MRPGWRFVVTGDGSLSFAGAGHGELAHSRDGAWTQARVRYAAGCEVRAKGFAAGGGGVVRLLDVGTGIGWNLAAAVAALVGTGARLEAVSLERDRGTLERAVGMVSAASGFPERCHRAVRRALGEALGGGGGWAALRLDGRDVGRLRVVVGDARETLPRLEETGFDAVFLDGFSLGVEGALWERGFLSAVARRMAVGARLSTYSAATRVRVALAAAGLGVARGARVGRKGEGTIAGPGLVAGPEDADLVRRLARRLADPGVDFSSGDGEGGVKIL